jgi:GNAT superfamily N-acetyltransferase
LTEPLLIQQIQLPVPGLEQLQTEALSEGYNFLETLALDWDSGANRFNGPGEILCGHLHQGLLVAVGGLNRDPFLDHPKIGRLRRIYVSQAWRNRGLGTALVNTLLNEARKTFHTVRLRAETPSAARLYERLGFVPIPNTDATHLIHLDIHC